MAPTLDSFVKLHLLYQDLATARVATTFPAHKPVWTEYWHYDLGVYCDIGASFCDARVLGMYNNSLCKHFAHTLPLCEEGINFMVRISHLRREGGLAIITPHVFHVFYEGYSI